MKIGVTLRNMGPQSDRQTMREGALHAEQLGFESVWITDHIAIPPDDAEGSGHADLLQELGNKIGNNIVGHERPPPDRR